jgi:hypothetical protein
VNGGADVLLVRVQMFVLTDIDSGRQTAYERLCISRKNCRSEKYSELLPERDPDALNCRSFLGSWFPD